MKGEERARGSIQDQVREGVRNPECLRKYLIDGIRIIFRSIISSRRRFPLTFVSCCGLGARFARDAEYCFRGSDAGEWLGDGPISFWAPRVTGRRVAELEPRKTTPSLGVGESESCGRGADSHRKWEHYE